MTRSQRIDYEILDLALKAKHPEGYPGYANLSTAWLRRIFPDISHEEYTGACKRLVARGALDLRKRTKAPGVYRDYRSDRDDDSFFYRKVHRVLYCEEFRLRRTPLSPAVFERLSVLMPARKPGADQVRFWPEDVCEGQGADNQSTG